jgi:hypothetical protein
MSGSTFSPDSIWGVIRTTSIAAIGRRKSLGK